MQVDNKYALNDISALWPWYAVRVKSNFEATTARSLEGKGLPFFVPFYAHRETGREGTTSTAPGRAPAKRPLFPGYVFSRFDVNNRLPVLICPGVVGIVSFGGVPLPVDESEIRAVQRITNSGLGAEPWPFLSVGRRLVVEAGPLKGLEGLVIEVKNSVRVVASISLLQRSVSVELDREWIRPLGKPIGGTDFGIADRQAAVYRPAA